MIDTISSQGFLDGVPFFWTELWPSHYKISFCLDPFSVTCFPSNHRKQSCKTWFCIRPHQTKCLSFYILDPVNKVALWSVLIQASLDCNFESTQKRRSRSHWKPNWQLVWKEILAAYACRCLQGTRDGGKKRIWVEIRVPFCSPGNCASALWKLIPTCNAIGPWSIFPYVQSAKPNNKIQ